MREGNFEFSLKSGQYFSASFTLLRGPHNLQIETLTPTIVWANSSYQEESKKVINWNKTLFYELSNDEMSSDNLKSSTIPSPNIKYYHLT